MRRKGPTSANLIQFPSQGKPQDPQGPDSPEDTRRVRRAPGSVLQHNREQMFVRFRANTLPRSIAATFQTSEREVVAIINAEFDRRLARRAA